jgi:nucleotide-binding universal stress UspA family protein
MDDSTFSKRALEYVARIRWPAGSTVLVASVLRPAFGASADRQSDRHRFHENLVERAVQCPREAGLATETRLLEGEPGDALVTAAAAERCDLLVVGSRGRSGLAKLLLGSVANHVVAHAPCSVLVVKQNGH